MLTRRELIVLCVAFVLSLPAVTTRLYASDEIEHFAWLRSLAFDRDVSFENEYQYFFDSLDELTDYLEDNEEFARASDDLLEHALRALQQAPSAPKIVIVQKTVVTALRKIG